MSKWQSFFNLIPVFWIWSVSSCLQGNTDKQTDAWIWMHKQYKHSDKGCLIMCDIDREWPHMNKHLRIDSEKNNKSMEM